MNRRPSPAWVAQTGAVMPPATSWRSTRTSPFWIFSGNGSATGAAARAAAARERARRKLRIGWVMDRLRGVGVIIQQEVRVFPTSALGRGGRESKIRRPQPGGYNSCMSQAIKIDPEVQGGTPCFAGTRVPVRSLFDYLAKGR